MLHSMTKPAVGQRLVSSPVTIAFITLSTLWLVSSIAIIGYSAITVA